MKDAHELELDPEGDGELMRNVKVRAVTQSDLYLRKTSLATLWKVGRKMASPEE